MESGQHSLPPVRPMRRPCTRAISWAVRTRLHRHPPCTHVVSQRLLGCAAVQSGRCCLSVAFALAQVLRARHLHTSSPPCCVLSVDCAPSRCSGFPRLGYVPWHILLALQGVRQGWQCSAKLMAQRVAWSDHGHFQARLVALAACLMQFVASLRRGIDLLHPCSPAVQGVRGPLLHHPHSHAVALWA